MPWAASTTSSSACCWSSQPSSYDIPEQPPPTMRMRKPHSGLPSSSRSSETFLAAVSVIVIIRSSRKTRRFCPERVRSSYHRMPPAGSSVSSSSTACGGSPAISTAARATSSGRSILSRGGEPARVSQSGVSTAPGMSTPTRTPLLRNSSASTRLKPNSPALVAVYTAEPGSARLAAIEATLTIVPSACRSIVGSTARQQTIAPRSVTGSIVSQSAGLLSTSEANDAVPAARSEEHTSELQSPCNLVCRLLLEKKKDYTSAPAKLSTCDQSASSLYLSTYAAPAVP